MNNDLKNWMGKSIFAGIICIAFAFSLGSPAHASNGEHPVIAIERTALERWGKGDPGGLLDIYRPDITYFDSGKAERVEGHAAMVAYYGRLFGKIHWNSWEMVKPRVVQNGNIAILTYVLKSEGMDMVGNLQTDTPKLQSTVWNSTSIYVRTNGKWQMIHSHWGTISSK